jgi:hypothetical protein
MTLPYLTKIRSTRGGPAGVIVGYGTLQWPATADINGDPAPVPVYLIQVHGLPCSAYGYQACVVVRADHMVEV